ncbi:MAG: DNA internalization-related competence protein ComEC/Rec2, partial [Lachnospiraceae bacterium]|nr:DNA internalization-related competence protein ComEC/Rec2 [Lachnospiraceae bacterium]
YIAGILLAYLQISPYLIFAGMLLIIYIKRNAYILCVLIFLIGGYIQMTEHSLSISPPSIKQTSYETEGKITKIIKDQYGYDIYLKNKEYAFLVTTKDAKELYKGDVIRVCGTIENFETARNEGNYDEKQYYNNKGLSCKIEADDIILLKRKNDLYKSLSKLSDKIERQLYKISKEKDADIYKAMLLGKKDTLSKEISELYRKAGISHILAISGLHISMIGMSLYHMLRKLYVNYAFSATLCAFIIIVYGVMTGNGVSTVRALVMFLMNVYASVVGRTYDIKTALSVSALMILMENPAYLFETSFLLSFAAILGICTVYPVLEPKNKFLQKIVVSLSITVTTLPISLYLFFEIPLYSVMVNVIVVPLMTLLFILLLISLMVSIFNISLAEWIMATPHYILELYEKICRFSETLPYSNVIIGRPQILQILILVLIFILLTTLGKRLRLELRYFIVLLMLSVLCFHFEKEMSFTMLDVSQGECMVIENKDAVYMVDCGSTDIKNVAQYRVIPYLKCKGIRDIDILFVTHADTDHISGIEEILSKDSGISVQTLAVAKSAMQDEKTIELINMANRSGCKIVCLEKGMSFFKDELFINVLHPVREFDNEDINEHSLVLELGYRELDILLTGDIGNAVEEDLLSIISKKYEVLKVAHHGSKNSSTEAFIEKVSPQIALISCGKDNMYGHPAPVVVDRLQRNETKLFLTMESGMIWVEEIEGKLVVGRYWK